MCRPRVGVGAGISRNNLSYVGIITKLGLHENSPMPTPSRTTLEIIRNLSQGALLALLLEVLMGEGIDIFGL